MNQHFLHKNIEPTINANDPRTDQTIIPTLDFPTSLHESVVDKVTVIY